MSQLIIQYNYLGQWARKYCARNYKEYKTLSVPRYLWNKDRIIGVTVDNREKWRNKLNSITQNADYEIIVKEQKHE